MTMTSEDTPDRMHSELERTFRLGNVTIKAPAYGVSINTGTDFRCLQDVFNFGGLKHTQIISYSLGDAVRFRALRDRTLFDLTGESQLLNQPRLSDTALIIDPMGECLEYFNSPEMEKLRGILSTKSLPKIPWVLKGLLLDNEPRLDISERRESLKSIFNDTVKLRDVVDWYLKTESVLGSSTTLAPSPPIEGFTTLKYAIETNRLAVTTQQDNGWKKSMFFCLDGKAFSNSSVITSLTDSIDLMGPEVVAIKLSNFNHAATGLTSKRNLQGLLDFLHENNKHIFSLFMNTDAILCHILAQGVSAAIEPISGDTQIFHRRKKNPLESYDDASWTYGKYPDPLKLRELPISDIKNILTNFGAYPCTCPYCIAAGNVTGNSEAYNQLRRKHRVCIRDMFISELLATKGSVRAAMADRLSEEESELNDFRSYYS